MSNNHTWRILAKQAAEEKDPEKLLQIVEALNLALMKGKRRRNPLKVKCSPTTLIFTCPCTTHPLRYF